MDDFMQASRTCVRRAPFAPVVVALSLGLSLALGAPALLAQTAAPAPAAASEVGAMGAGQKETGKIAWYGKQFAGRRTASGEAFDPEAMTMAHKTLPFGTKVKVTNPKNQASVTLRVNDRGPTHPDRVADVSLAAARKLGMVRAGVIDAELEVVAAAPARKGKK
ncbi:MAG TPA: septal ring lytic transglycosylase RlpA family protein [Burkholderiaceae bacterium]|nr:septal ring lytic transglycosylase RlpA family protein [Burkholderiaceae bacterium]